jgi:hypothetical protein
LHTSFAHQSHMVLRGFVTSEWEAVAKVLTYDYNYYGYMENMEGNVDAMQQLY